MPKENYLQFLNPTMSADRLLVKFIFGWLESWRFKVDLIKKFENLVTCNAKNLLLDSNQ